MTHRFRFTCTRLLPACALAARLVGPPGFAPSANAADVTYPGSNLDKGPLWNIDNSLFPAGSLSDNVVTINSGNVGPVSQKPYDTIYGMQTGTVKDYMGWIVTLD